MGFIAGLIVGISGGALSWIAAAAWLESKRQDGARCNVGSGDPRLVPIHRLRRQLSRS